MAHMDHCVVLALHNTLVLEAPHSDLRVQIEVDFDDFLAGWNNRIELEGHHGCQADIDENGGAVDHKMIHNNMNRYPFGYHLDLTNNYTVEQVVIAKNAADAGGFDCGHSMNLNLGHRYFVGENSDSFFHSNIH